MTPRVGTVLSLPGVLAAELVGRHFDTVWIDLEHAALGRRDMQDAVIGVQASGADAYVRVPLTEPFGAILDAAADGVAVPHVEAAEEAREAVDRLRMAPSGSRGYGPRRLAVRPGPETPACIVQIETARGVEAAAAIASVRGLEALVVGCADLSYDLGEPLRFESPSLHAAVAAVAEAAEAAGLVFGVAGLPLGIVPDRAELVITGSDIRLFDAALAEAASAVMSHHGKAACPST
jgi:2-keto-3-deoxy-L-rhamnonate aldolase RhmA